VLHLTFFFPPLIQVMSQNELQAKERARQQEALAASGFRAPSFSPEKSQIPQLTNNPESPAPPIKYHGKQSNVAPDLISSHIISSHHPILSYLISSYLISSHLILSYLMLSDLILIYLTAFNAGQRDDVHLPASLTHESGFAHQLFTPKRLSETAFNTSFTTPKAKGSRRCVSSYLILCFLISSDLIS
jgi:hypothetical protein